MSISLTDSGLLMPDGQIIPTGGDRSPSYAIAETSTNRSLTYSTSWTDHLSVTFTVNQVCAIRCIGVFGPSYESGVVIGTARFQLDSGSTSPDCTVAYQADNNKATGPHGLSAGFNNVSTGSHTVKLQVRNLGSSSTWILNYWGDPDRLIVDYI